MAMEPEGLPNPARGVKRWQANMDALRTLRAIEAEGRTATAAERRVLEGYSGFGGTEFNKAFDLDSSDRAWQRRGNELRELLTEDEYHSITRDRGNSFYTTPEIIRHMWDGVRKLGADDAESLRVLEPSAGAGRFLEYQPRDLAAKSERTAVEIVDSASRILKAKFPNDKVYHSGFEKAPLPDDHYDVAISNVPFGTTGVSDISHENYITRRIHNYFFAKSLDKLRPGGVVAFITSAGTLNAPGNEDVREYLSERADFLGAVRLPTGAFPDTDVVADIIYLRKREEGTPPRGDLSWVKTGKQTIDREGGYGTREANVNQYFIDNPQNVLGTPVAGHGVRSGLASKRDNEDDESYKVLPEDLSKLPARINRAIDSQLADDPPTLATRPEPRTKPQSVAPPKPQLSAAEQGRVDSLKGIHAQVEGLMRLESTSDDAGGIETARKTLRAAYDAYRKDHGALVGKNNREMIVHLESELGRPAAALLALETKEGKAANLLEGRQLRPVSKVIETPQDAMLASQGQLGKIDFDYMAKLLPGQTEDSVRNALIAQGSVYHSPTSQNWVTESEYLSGNVVKKLEEAKVASTANDFYQRNVAALETAQPPSVTEDKISVRLGSHWIPPDVINEFVDEAFQVQQKGRQEWVHYADDQAMWLMDKNPPLDRSGRFNAGDDYNAADILKHVIQNKAFRLSSKKDDTPGEKKRKSESEELARAKADLLQEEFQNWVWADPVRRERLVENYNLAFNTNVPREFDERGRLSLSGMSDEWRSKMREHQRDAVFRDVHDGSVLLAHEVGFGKTAVMIAAAMERKRLGLTKKPMIVVPKPIIGQFVEGFRDMYPGANVLTPTAGDFSGANREKFLARAATHDWDSVVVTQEQFKEIPLQPETETKWYKEQIRQTRSALETVKDNDDGGSKKGNAQNALENRLKHWEKRLGDVQARIKLRQNTGVTWEQMGVDKLIVDEAHHYKNLPFVTMMGTIKGLPNSSSDRAWDMYMKANVLQERGGKRQAGTFARNGVTFATGTPVSNTIAETWTMMRYLQPKELERRGYDKFDAWAGDFATTKDETEPTVDGQYKVTTRFIDILNIPSLKNLFQNVADIRVARETPSLQKARPWIRADDGSKGRMVVQAPLHPELERFMDVVAKRGRAISSGAVKPDEDNMLWLANDANEAALDVRMQRADAAYNPMGKIQMAAENVAKIYRETDADKGTQLIFLDRGTPPSGERAKKAQEGYVINQYEVMREELANRGVPRDKVKFIHESTTDEKRDALFEKVNDGDVRVLMASTEKGGTGVNVQKRAAALHHIDISWRPSDVEQREGRIVRQGNKVYGPKLDEKTGEVLDPGKGVQIFSYVQEGSFDEFKWGTIEAKAKPLHTIMQRYIDPNVITMKDVDDAPPTAAMEKALASRDPVALQAANAEEEVKKLQRLKRATQSQITQAEKRVRDLSEDVTRNEGAVPRLEADARMVESQPKPDDKNFSMEITDRWGNRETAQKKGEASRELAKALLEARQNASDRRRGVFVAVEEYRGFAIEPYTNGARYSFALVSPTGQVYSTTNVDRGDIAGTNWLQRIDNLIDDIPAKLDERKENIAEKRRELQTQQVTASSGFTKQAELTDAEEELALAERELALRTDEGRRKLEEFKAKREATTTRTALADEPDTDSATAIPIGEPRRVEEMPVRADESVPSVGPTEDFTADESVTFVVPSPAESVTPTADSDETPGETVAPDPVEGPSPETLPATEPDESDLVTVTEFVQDGETPEPMVETGSGKSPINEYADRQQERLDEIAKEIEANALSESGRQYQHIAGNIERAMASADLPDKDRERLEELRDSAAAGALASEGTEVKRREKNKREYVARQQRHLDEIDAAIAENAETELGQQYFYIAQRIREAIDSGELPAKDNEQLEELWAKAAEGHSVWAERQRTIEEKTKAELKRQEAEKIDEQIDRLPSFTDEELASLASPLAGGPRKWKKAVEKEVAKREADVATPEPLPASTDAPQEAPETAVMPETVSESTDAPQKPLTKRQRIDEEYKRLREIGAEGTRKELMREARDTVEENDDANAPETDSAQGLSADSPPTKVEPEPKWYEGEDPFAHLPKRWDGRTDEELRKLIEITEDTINAGFLSKKEIRKAQSEQRAIQEELERRAESPDAPVSDEPAPTPTDPDKVRRRVKDELRMSGAAREKAADTPPPDPWDVYGASDETPPAPKPKAEPPAMATSADMAPPDPWDVYGAVDEPAKPARRVAKESKAERELKRAEKAANKAEKELDKAQEAFFENRGTGAALDKALDRLDKAGAKVEQAESQLADTAAPSIAETVTQPASGLGHKPAKGKVAKRRKPPQRKQGKVSIGLPSRQAAKAVFAGRSPASQSADLARQNSNVITPKDPGYAAWVRDGGTADIKGVDTLSDRRAPTTDKALLSRAATAVGTGSRRRSPRKKRR